MTSFIAWIGVDSRGPSALYLASDSRISWPRYNLTWDCGRKLFASTKYPEILGYYGSIDFPSHILAQIIDLIDRDLLFDNLALPNEKRECIYSLIRRSFEKYPSQLDTPFTIVYCTRQNEGMSSEFHVSKIQWLSRKLWEVSWLQIPSQSDVILTSGSGSQSINHWYERWSNSSEKGTSRSVFSAFCDSLLSKEDKYSGGAPQLVGIYRMGTAKTFGVIHENRRFLFGLPVDKSHNLDHVEWRDHLFERCDWNTKKLLVGAQEHHRPDELS